MQKRETAFCITHTEPSIPAAFYDHILALGTFGETSETHVSKLDSFWHAARPLAFSAAGSYTVEKAALKVGSTSDIIGIVSQRKFLSQTPAGVSSRSYPALREVSSLLLADIAPETTKPVAGHDFLFAAPVGFSDGLVAQYARAHRAVDILDYLSLANKLDILQKDELTQFVTMKHLVPGGCECGYYPRTWLKQTFGRAPPGVEPTA